MPVELIRWGTSGTTAPTTPTTTANILSYEQTGLNRSVGGVPIGPFLMEGRSVCGITVEFSGLLVADPDAIARVEIQTTTNAPWAVLGNLAPIDGVAGGAASQYIHFSEVAGHAVRLIYASGGGPATRLNACYVSLVEGAALPGAAAVVPPNQPTIGTPTVISQVGEVLSIQWPITMAATGTVAASLVVDVFDVSDTVFAIPLATRQTITTGIGLGEIVNVSFTGLDGMDGATPRSFVIRAEAS